MSYADHAPLGNGPRCARDDCRRPRRDHRVNHKFQFGGITLGTLDLCARCFLPEENHSLRSHGRKRDRAEREFFMGVDGEGVGRGPHRYVMLCAKDESGERQSSVEDANGLSTVAALEFLLAQPRAAKLFAFSFGYDLTKILQDVDDAKLYELMHPEGRIPEATPANPYPNPCPVLWEATWRGERAIYKLNWIGSKFWVIRGKRRATVWDVWKFFGTAFVRALRDWGVGTPEALARIDAMKAKRGADDWMNDPAKVDEARAYCFDECHYLAQLARKLVTAHEHAALDLRNFHGAGSTADAMLKTMNIGEKLQGLAPPMGPPTRIKGEIVKLNVALFHAVMAAFFGGRFENSVVGEVRGRVYNVDLSSAYPYQVTFLPCLQHGTWSRTTDRKRLETSRAAVVRYELGDAPRDLEAWGPLPFRDVDGSIVYPKESGGGWAWRDEFIAAERMCSHVRFSEAFVLDGDCDCQPFAEVPRYYRERLAIGKEGAGLVFKLGPNSIYGKLAQTIGRPRYQSFVWAGIVTSGTRAQILDVIARHRDPSNVLSIATDGIITRERIDLPAPRDTGTADAKKSAKEIAATRGKTCATCGAVSCELAHKPLGGWETKIAEKGVFFARPGILWDLESADLEKIRARGVGRRTLFEHLEKIRAAWHAGESGIVIESDDETKANMRFWGIRSSVRKPHTQGATSAHAQRDRERFGEWLPMPVEMSFDPMPKRSAMVRDGGTFARLTLRSLPRDVTSCAYHEAPKSAEQRALAENKIVQSEQHDVIEFENEDTDG